MGNHLVDIDSIISRIESKTQENRYIIEKPLLLEAFFQEVDDQENNFYQRHKEEDGLFSNFHRYLITKDE